MLKNTRHEKILELISKQEIETQEELCDALSACGYPVTQATVSRDIRILHLYKEKGENKRFRYTVAERQSDVPEAMLSLFRACVLDVRAVGNMIVIKTLEGSGGNAGAVVDGLNYAEVVGSIAGDDTVFSVCDSGEAAKSVAARFKELLK